MLAKVDDTDGAAFWQRSIGAKEYKVSFKRFVAQLRAVPMLVSESAERSLQAILDANDTGYVSVYKFASFLDGFGPSRSCIDNVEAVVNAGWFHWYVCARRMS